MCEIVGSKISVLIPILMKEKTWLFCCLSYGHAHIWGCCCCCCYKQWTSIALLLMVMDSELGATGLITANMHWSRWWSADGHIYVLQEMSMFCILDGENKWLSYGWENVGWCFRWTTSATSITSTCTELTFLNQSQHLNSCSLTMMWMLESCQTFGRWAFIHRQLLRCRLLLSCCMYVIVWYFHHATCMTYLFSSYCKCGKIACLYYKWYCFGCHQSDCISWKYDCHWQQCTQCSIIKVPASF